MTRLLENANQATSAILDFEGKKLLRWIGEDIPVRQGTRILDIGCGFGRRLKPLRDAGYQAIGIEVNPETVSAVRAKGFECLSPEEFIKNPFVADALIFSHVVEHFSPADLLKFMNGYLKHLKPGGLVFVATPLLSASFYDDFDHVKPYQPAGLIMVFVESSAQVQFQSSSTLQLKRLWYRRSPLKLTHFAGLYLPSFSGKLLRGFNLVLRLLFLASLGILGRKDGWIGEFEKRPV